MQEKKIEIKDFIESIKKLDKKQQEKAYYVMQGMLLANEVEEKEKEPA